MIGKCLFLLMILSQPPAAEPTALERLTPDFHGAVGTSVRVAWSIPGGTAVVGRPSRVVLQVFGAENPADLAAPKSAFAEPHPGYQIVEGPTTIASNASSGVVEFAYDLVPNSPGAHSLPSVKYAYFRPGFPEGRRFAVAYAEGSIFIAAPDARSTLDPATRPTTSLTPPPINETTRDVSPWATLFLAASAPWWLYLASTVVERLFPDAARTAALWNTRAVRLARRRLDKATSSRQVRQAVLDWLIGRRGLPATVTTSADVERALPVIANRYVEVVAFIRDCERAEYASAPKPELRVLVERAKELVLAVEGER